MNLEKRGRRRTELYAGVVVVAAAVVVFPASSAVGSHAFSLQLPLGLLTPGSA